MKRRQCLRTFVHLISFIIAISAVSAVALADVKVPKIFGDRMVLQQKRPIPVLGWADPCEKVAVRTARMKHRRLLTQIGIGGSLCPL